jgi:hypothetical protein
MIVEPCVAMPKDCWAVKAGNGLPIVYVRMIEGTLVCDTHKLGSKCVDLWAVKAWKNKNVSEKYGS